MHRLLAAVAVLFGIATLFAGTRVLSGADPGYAVTRPLLLFNTAMGVAYIATGVLGWVRIRPAAYAALAIFVLNALVLAVVATLHFQQGGVAVESVRAMVLRTVVWLVLFVGWFWLARRRSRVPA